MSTEEFYKDFFGVEPKENSTTVNQSVLAFAEQFAKHYAAETLSELERVKEDNDWLKGRVEILEADYKNQAAKLSQTEKERQELKKERDQLAHLLGQKMREIDNAVAKDNS